MSSRKRKSTDHETPLNVGKRTKASTDEPTGQHIQKLADTILESSQNYNRVADLLKLAKSDGSEANVAAAALCRVFSVLWLQDRMKRTQPLSKEAKQVASWLLERYSEYKSILLRQVKSDPAARCKSALALLMRLVQAELESNPDLMSSMSISGTFHDTVKSAVLASNSDLVAEIFIEVYASRYEDVRLLMLRSFIGEAEQASGKLDSQQTDRLISVLARLGGTRTAQATQDETTELLFSKRRNYKKDELRKKTGDLWLLLLRQALTKEQRRRLLNLMSTHIEPTVRNPELLLDFLSDCCDGEGPDAIIALNGLLALITEHGLDYPLLYHKLYALLDSHCMHKKLRSRFLRLMNTFLASTHLPAVLVASFIKRLSRLALFGPPAAIVSIAPFIYNLMQLHPACTPMLHRSLQQARSYDEQHSFLDHFDAAEQDPILTGAIDSSLWELDTLRNHWHPNVATIAKILAEQFLKQSYNLEDFLDHSYGSLFDTEVAKSIKKPPALEYNIPKHVFTHDENIDDTDRNLMRELWQF